MSKPKTKPLTISVSRRSLLGRLERALVKQGRELQASRQGHQTTFLLIDTEKQALLDADVDLEALAKSIGAMKPWEELAGGDE